MTLLLSTQNLVHIIMSLWSYVPHNILYYIRVIYVKRPLVSAHICVLYTMFLLRITLWVNLLIRYVSRRFLPSTIVQSTAYSHTIIIIIIITCIIISGNSIIILSFSPNCLYEYSYF